MYSATPGLLEKMRGEKETTIQKQRLDILTPVLVIGGIIIVIVLLVAVLMQ